MIINNIEDNIKSINDILIDNENIVDISIQHRIFALLHRRQILIATTGRLIWMKRNLIAGFKIIDYRWQDIGEVQIYQGLFGSDLTIKFYLEQDLSLNTNNNSAFIKLIGFDKNKTKDIYKYAQYQDQSWREKRRIRSLEELRAKSGGITLGTEQHGNRNYSYNNIEQLEQAKILLEKGLITDAEYEGIKAKIINRV